MTTFTDDDMKDFQKHIDEFTQCIELQELWPKLLARLEAAELALNKYVSLEDERVSYDDAVSCLNIWRKAAGK